MSDKIFQFWPASASSVAPEVDLWTFVLTALTMGLTILICGVIVIFVIRFRRRLGNMYPPDVPSPIWMEITWTAIPMGIMLVIFFGGAGLYVRMFRPPVDAMRINIIGKQWMWKAEHPEGAREINQLHVPLGKDVELVMISQDVIHSFFIPAFRLHQDVLPGRYTMQWFRATQTGTYHLFCSQFCGTEHSKMIGTVIVMQPGDYQRWLAGAARSEPAKTAGEKLFISYGCMVCHSTRAPSLAGVFGRTVQLEDGHTVLADEDYLRESILNPAAKIVKGFPPIMPTFKGQITEEQMIQLIAYIKSLSASANPGPVELKNQPPGSPATQPLDYVPGPLNLNGRQP